MRKVIAVLSVLLISIGMFAYVNEGYVSPVVNVVKYASPAVVNIEAVGKSQQSSLYDPYFDDFFKRFFGGELPDTQKDVTAIGSGFIFDKAGYILTNYHVVENSSKITVSMADGKKFDAKLVGGDSELDLAVIKIETQTDLPVLELGDSDKIDIGEWAVAIGNPLGLKHTVTLGVVSAINRRIAKPDGSGYYVDLIQTDAAINPGNSGGPLVNIHAQVMGINTAIINTSEGVNLGFAIPINIAKRFASSIIKDGKFEKAYLGVVVQTVNEELVKALGLKVESGALISDVEKDSPAEKAGIKTGDVIVKLDERVIESNEDLVSYLRAYSANTKANIIINRKGQELKLNVILSSKESKIVTAKKSYFGITVREITADDISEMGLKKDLGGVMVETISSSSQSILGLKTGDIITSIAVNGKESKIATLKDWESVASTVKKDSYIALLVYRKSYGNFYTKFYYRGE